MHGALPCSFAESDGDDVYIYYIQNNNTSNTCREIVFFCSNFFNLFMGKGACCFLCMICFNPDFILNYNIYIYPFLLLTTPIYKMIIIKKKPKTGRRGRKKKRRKKKDILVFTGKNFFGLGNYGGMTTW